VLVQNGCHFSDDYNKVIGNDLLLETAYVKFKFADQCIPHGIQEQYFLTVSVPFMCVVSSNAETALSPITYIVKKRVSERNL
jgi:hypothetical protein